MTAGTPSAVVTNATREAPRRVIEPMAGVTNSMNLAHKGLYKELQSVPPNGSWEESFWIRPRGF